MELATIEPLDAEAAAAHQHDLDSQVNIREALDFVGVSGIPHVVLLELRKGTFTSVQWEYGVPTVRLREFVSIWNSGLNERAASGNGRSPNNVALPDGYVRVIDFIRDNVAPLAARGLVGLPTKTNKKGGLGSVMKKAMIYQEVSGARRASDSKTAPWIAPKVAIDTWLRSNGYIA